PSFAVHLVRLRKSDRRDDNQDRRRDRFGEGRPLNVKGIIGFPEPLVERREEAAPAAPIARFLLGDELRRVRAAETARLAGLAGRVLDQFGPVVTVGFLYFEVLGSPADEADCATQADRLRQAPSAITAIIKELLATAESRQQSIAPVRASGPST